MQTIEKSAQAQSPLSAVGNQTGSVVIVTAAVNLVSSVITEHVYMLAIWLNVRHVSKSVMP